MKFIILYQVLLGFTSLVLGSPSASPDSLVPLQVREDFTLTCPPPELSICTIQLRVTKSLPARVFDVEIFDYMCQKACSQLFYAFDARMSWSPSCLGGQPMTVQVDGNGEVHPIFYDYNQLNIGIVPDGNNQTVTHRIVFGCPSAIGLPDLTISSAPTTSSTPTTSSAPASTQSTACEWADQAPSVEDECYLPWLQNHTFAAGSGNTPSN